jgi:general secretion pathway protein B
MSYILDALKKADAERARDASAVPDLHAQADAAVHGMRTPASRWPLLGAAALLIGLVLWWAWPWFGSAPSEPAPAVAAAPAPRSEPAPVPAAQPTPPPVAVPAAPAAIAPSIATAPAAKPSPRVAAQAPATASAATPTRVPTLAELPPELRSQMPTLAVGGSVYSPQAASRIVILNGQVFREGDKPLDGLVVERIGLKSTLLVYRGTRFELKH